MSCLVLASITACAAEGGDDLAVNPVADPALRMRWQQRTADERIDVFVEGAVTREALEALDARVRTHAGDIWTADLPLARVDELVRVPGITRVTAAQPVALQALNENADEAHVREAQGRSGTPGERPTYGGLTGAGVIVGVVDSGLDLAHADFRDASGRSRVIRIWDHTWFPFDQHVAPSGFAYGVEYTGADIAAGSVAQFLDSSGHGTHVASVAAGTGAASGNGQEAYRFTGVAPEADLVVVRLDTTSATNPSSRSSLSPLLETRVVDACAYVFAVATAMGKPAVCSLALSQQRGAHDGSYVLDRALSALTGPGRVISVAAGNFGDQPVHGRMMLAAGATEALGVELPVTGTHVTDAIILQGWLPQGDAYEFKLTSPTGSETPWIAPGVDSGYLATSSGYVMIQNAVVANDRGARQLVVAMWQGNTQVAAVARGRWLVHARRVQGAQPLDWWISHVAGNLAGAAIAAPHRDPSRTIGSPATADRVTRRARTSRGPRGATRTVGRRCKRRRPPPISSRRSRRAVPGATAARRRISWRPAWGCSGRVRPATPSAPTSSTPTKGTSVP